MTIEGSDDRIRDAFSCSEAAASMGAAGAASLLGFGVRRSIAARPFRKFTVPLKLILANKAYSSWSLRPWILLAQLKIPFEEVVIPMDQPETRETMLRYAPTGKCPSLQDGKIAVWESLATIEYIAEAYPEKPIW